MTPQRFAIATLVGGVAVFTTGVLLFALPPFHAFYAYAMTSGSATGVMRESPLIWAVAVGALAYSALITFALAARPGVPTIATGVTTGALVGLLLWVTANFMLYGISNVGNLSSALLDSLLELVPGAIGGAVISAVLRRLR